MLALVAYGLATWRISHILLWETGPWYAITRWRRWLGIEHDEDGKPVSWPDNHVLACLWCTSVWVALVLAVLPPRVAQVFAASAIAILVEEHIDGSSTN